MQKQSIIVIILLSRIRSNEFVKQLVFTITRALVEYIPTLIIALSVMLAIGRSFLLLNTSTRYTAAVSDPVPARLGEHEMHGGFKGGQLSMAKSLMV